MPEKERLPPMAKAAMTPAQAQVAAAISDGPRGGVNGPFAVLLRSPELLDRTQKLGEHIRFGSPLSDRLREWAVLVISARWRQNYEWSVHAPLALKAGVAASLIDAVARDRPPEGMNEQEAVVYAVCRSLSLYANMEDPLFDRAKAVLGESGLVELAALCGYYTMLAMVLNMAGTPPAAAGPAPF